MQTEKSLEASPSLKGIREPADRPDALVVIPRRMLNGYTEWGMDPLYIPGLDPYIKAQQFQ